MEPRKVVEEEYPQQRFAKELHKELNQSMRDAGSIPRVDTRSLESSILSKNSENKLRLLEPLKSLLRTLLKLMVFALLCLIVLNWNHKLFQFGEFQLSDTRNQKCVVANRFDYSDGAWTDELLRHSKSHSKEKLLVGLERT